MSGRRIYLNIRHKISRFLNPALCLSCGIPINSADFICEYCLASLQHVPSPCYRCGLPNGSNGRVCAACRHRPPRWDNMIAPLMYADTTRKLIQAFKYQHQVHHANAMLTHLFPCYSNHPVEVLIPVPLHKTRLLERGFNQSEEIASILSYRLKIPLDRKSLSRIKATEPQSGLSLNKRRQNILKAFVYKPVKNYHSVAIIDDIITTGSTLAEISKVLRRSGVTHIEVWSLARALKET